MAVSIAEIAEKPQKTEIKLYDKDLKGLKDIDVDDKLCLHINVKAISKYHEDYRPGNPLCITFEVEKARVCDEDS